jgi:hypothetical protein
MNSGWLETGKDHRMATGSPGSSARALRRSATVLQRSSWSLRRSVAACLLPDAPSMTFGPQPGDHLSRTVEEASPPPPVPAIRRPRPLGVPMAWKAVATCCPAFEEHAGPKSRIYAEQKQDVLVLVNEMTFGHLPAEDLEPPVHAELSLTCTTSAGK